MKELAKLKDNSLIKKQVESIVLDIIEGGFTSCRDIAKKHKMDVLQVVGILSSNDFVKFYTRSIKNLKTIEHLQVTPDRLLGIVKGVDDLTSIKAAEALDNILKPPVVKHPKEESKLPDLHLHLNEVVKELREQGEVIDAEEEYPGLK